LFGNCHFKGLRYNNKRRELLVGKRNIDNTHVYNTHIYKILSAMSQEKWQKLIRSDPLKTLMKEEMRKLNSMTPNKPERLMEIIIFTGLDDKFQVSTLGCLQSQFRNCDICCCRSSCQRQ
jgi:hypothetical protein